MKTTILKTILIILLSITGAQTFAQYVQGFEPIIGFKAIAVGDIIEKGNWVTQSQRAEFYPELKDTLTIRNIAYSSNVTKGYNAGIDIDASLLGDSSLWAGLNAYKNAITKAELVVDSGYVKVVKGGNVAFRKVLENMSIGNLEVLNNTIGKKSEFVSEVFFVKKGKVKITFDKNAGAKIAADLVSVIKAKPGWTWTNEGSLEYTYPEDLSVAYKPVAVKQQVKDALCKKKGDCSVWYQEIPILGIKQFTHKQGGWGSLFLGTEVGCSVAGTVLILNSNHLYNQYKQTEYEPYYNKCKKQEAWAIGCFVGAGAMFLWNIYHSSTIKDKATALTPALLFDPQGSPQPALALNIHF